jgi:hypothetical protein
MPFRIEQFIRQCIRNTHESSGALSFCILSALTVLNGGTVLKADGAKSGLSPRTEAINQENASEHFVLRLARLIGRQIARENIENHRSDCASPEGEET